MEFFFETFGKIRSTGSWTCPFLVIIFYTIAARRSKLQQVELDLGSAHLELAREKTAGSTGLRTP